MATMKNKPQVKEDVPFLVRPEVGTGLTIASGLAFLLTGMLLPLVGKAGSKVTYYGSNFAAFLAVLVVTIVFSSLAIRSKLERRKIDGSPLPKLSISILSSSVILLVSLLLGLLKI